MALAAHGKYVDSLTHSFQYKYKYVCVSKMVLLKIMGCQNTALKTNNRKLANLYVCNVWTYKYLFVSIFAKESLEKQFP